MSDIPTKGPAQPKPESDHTQEPDPDPEAPVPAPGSPPGPDDVKIIPPDSGVALAIRSGPDPLLLTLTLDAGTTLVNQVNRTVFRHVGDEALYAIIESSLVDITWVPIFTRHNFTTSPIPETIRTLTRRTVTQGTETNRELNIGAAYNGLSISFGISHRTFSHTETVSEREVTTVYTVPPQSSLHVYQRRYRFREEIWWIADAWNALWNVSTPGGGFVRAIATFHSAILADEQIAVDRPLTGSQRVQVPLFRPTTVPWNQTNRQFQNHTSRTRNAVQRTLNDAHTGP